MDIEAALEEPLDQPGCDVAVAARDEGGAGGVGGQCHRGSANRGDRGIWGTIPANKAEQ